MQTENFYDGNWRPVLDLSDKAIGKLRDLGFEFGSDSAGHLAARWPVKPELPALVFTSAIARDYWREELRRDCAVSLARLRRIVEAQGCDYAATVRAVRR